jgi:hypothetical protein
MRPHNFTQESQRLGRAWFAVPVSIIAAVVAVLVMVSAPESTGLTADIVLTDAIAAHPYGGAYGVPSAASVFTERRHEVTEHVDTF